MTATEIVACRVFDQDWYEVAYRPAIEVLVAPVHGGLHGLGWELRELLLEVAGDPGYCLGFAAGLAAVVSAGTRTHDILHARCGRSCSLRGLAWPMGTVIIRRGMCDCRHAVS